jgi:hypothetical protein
MFYNSTTGYASVGHVDTSGNYTDLKVANIGGTIGWTHIVPVGGGRLLFYNSNNGRSSVGQVASDGTYTDAPNGAYAFTLGVGWTHVVSAGSDMVVYYSTNTGMGGTARVNADGTVTPLKAYTTFSTGWTHIVGLSNGIYFYYERGTGNAATDRVNADGSIVRLKYYANFIQKIWTTVTAGTNGTILFSYSVDGRGVAGKVGDNGFYTALQGYPDPQGNLPLPIPFPVVAGLSNGTLLFYNDSQRSAVTARLRADGSIPIYSTIPPGTFQVWTHIVGIR